ncbi:MspA family porin [Nocardia sp. NPDC058058]|uniref:MspA family porin n=1 Tax=Nocardia sp. NPDC058058 TaxID=3346317 RepID=UPI0036DD684B
MTGRELRLAALSAGAACAVLLSSGSAGADSFIPLPDGGKSFTTATGIAVDITRSGEGATISPALAANSMSRTVWVSGRSLATVDGASAGTLETGYLLGCQVDLSGGMSAGGDLAVGIESFVPEIVSSIELKPGAVAAVSLSKKELAPEAGAVGYGYHNRGLQIDGCGGYAQARGFTNLTVRNGGGSTVVTLYGAPFTLG